jgi:hypothetical protein
MSTSADRIAAARALQDDPEIDMLVTYSYSRLSPKTTPYAFGTRRHAAKAPDPQR